MLESDARFQHNSSPLFAGARVSPLLSAVFLATRPGPCNNMARKKEKTWPQINTRLGSSLSAVILTSPSWTETELKCGKKQRKNNKEPQKHSRRRARHESSDAPLRFLDPGAA
ncbi:hypothetical protein NDU88_004325 [Pleurodeles waltl]|uniref:Uncharacterized protein n=1 Tax=Pleurodeles waltl TaxID=8319 RepID=A0AAV7KZ62_PLEWA|nr:hypothetical protein NDU88_004325 [Pleurodeles waltl]